MTTSGRVASHSPNGNPQTTPGARLGYSPRHPGTNSTVFSIVRQPGTTARPTRGMSDPLSPLGSWNPPWTETPQAPHGIRLRRTTRAVTASPSRQRARSKLNEPSSPHRLSRGQMRPRTVTTTIPNKTMNPCECRNIPQRPAAAAANPSEPRGVLNQRMRCAKSGKRSWVRISPRAISQARCFMTTWGRETGDEGSVWASAHPLTCFRLQL